MIVRRRTWLYRLPGESTIRSISFKLPLTARQVKMALRQSVGVPSDIWGRSFEDPTLRKA